MGISCLISSWGNDLKLHGGMKTKNETENVVFRLLLFVYVEGYIIPISLNYNAQFSKFSLFFTFQFYGLSTLSY